MLRTCSGDGLKDTRDCTHLGATTRYDRPDTSKMELSTSAGVQDERLKGLWLTEVVYCSMMWGTGTHDDESAGGSHKGGGGEARQ